MGRKQRLAMEAARAREEALKAERRMGEVFRGKELSKVKAFAEAKVLEHKEREAAFLRFVRGKQVRSDSKRYGETQMVAAYTIMLRNCPECGECKWDCRCGQIWGNGCTLVLNEDYRRTEAACTADEVVEESGEEESETESDSSEMESDWEEEEDEFDYDGVVAWIEGTPEAKKKPEEKHATPEVANAQKKRTGGRRSLFASCSK